MRIKDIIMFIYKNEIEWHWFDDNGNKDVVIFIDDSYLIDFKEMLSSSDYDDSGIVIVLKEHHICIKMASLLENNDIDICDIFDINENSELISHLL